MPSWELTLDQREIDRDVGLIVSAILTQAKGSIRTQTRGLERDLEKLTKQAAGGNLWRAWQSEIFPRGNKLAYSPSGEVFVKGGSRTRGAMIYWSQAGINRARDDFWLAIPTAAAGVNNRSRSMTPGEWEQRTGKRLDFVYQGNGEPALLVVHDVYVGANGSGVRRATARRAGGVRYSGAKTQTVVIFTLIPYQRYANKFSIEPAVERRGKMLRDDFERRMSRMRDAVEGLRDT